MNEIVLSIIIVSFNTREYIEEGLCAIYSNLPAFPFEVIVVDNHSNDGTANLIRARFPTVRLIVNEYNRYFAPAINQGIRMCQGMHVLMLNSDAIVKGQVLKVMVDFLETNPQVGGVGGAVRHPGGNIGWTYWSQVRKWDILRKLQPISYFLDQREVFKPSVFVTEAYEVETLTGAFLMVRRNVFERIGLLDERMRMWYVEDDLCIRLRQAGWKLYYLSSAEAYHHRSRSTRKVNKSKIEYVYMGDIFHFARKYFGRGVALGLLPFLIIHFTMVMFIVWRNKLRANI